MVSSQFRFQRESQTGNRLDMEWTPLFSYHCGHYFVDKSTQNWDTHNGKCGKVHSK